MAKYKSGKIKQPSVSEKLRTLYSDKKIEYDNDGLLTQSSVDFLKNHFRSDNICTANRRSASHTSRHSGRMSDAEMIDAMHVPDPEKGTVKHTVTQFPNERTQWTAIMDTICDHVDKWMDDHMSSNVRNGTRFQYTTDSTVDVHNGTNTTGWTKINGFLHRCDTEGYVSLVVDKNTDAPMGFTIHTAYPGLAYDPANDTSYNQSHKTSLVAEVRQKYINVQTDDYRDIMKQTQLYKNSESPLERARLLLQANPALVHGYDTQNARDIADHQISVSGMKQSRNGKPRFYINQEIDNNNRYSCIVDDQDIYIQKLDGENRRVDFWTDTGDLVTSVGVRHGTLESIKNRMPEMYMLAKAANEYIQEERAQSRTQTLDSDLSVSHVQEQDLVKA